MARSRIEYQDGFAIHVLQSEAVELRIVPDLGAKISSLRSLRTGREWMWRPPEARLFPNDLHDPFAESTIVGADECFPTIGPCPWAGRDLPDHGEVWSQKWQVTAQPGAIETFLQCPLSPFALSRKVTLAGADVTLAYRATNTGSSEEAYLWAFHPLLAIHPGDRLELLGTHLQSDMSINCGYGGWQEGWEKQWPWPQPSEGVDLESMDFGPHESAAVKFFTTSLHGGRASLYNPAAKEKLEFLFDPAEIDTVGLWLNRGGWNDFHHVAIEPCLGAPDRLDIAATRTGRCRRLAPGASASWKFTLRLS